MDNLKLTAGRYSPCAECDKKPCSSCMYQYLFNEYQAKIDEHKKVSTNRKKLIVHESDYNGQGYFGILGNSKSFLPYSYEDEDTGDIHLAVENLIKVGFIDKKDVLLVSGSEIYEYLKEKGED